MHLLKETCSYIKKTKYFLLEIFFSLHRLTTFFFKQKTKQYCLNSDSHKRTLVCRPISNQPIRGSIQMGHRCGRSLLAGRHSKPRRTLTRKQVFFLFSISLFSIDIVITKLNFGRINKNKQKKMLLFQFLLMFHLSYQVEKRFVHLDYTPTPVSKSNVSLSQPLSLAIRVVRASMLALAQNLSFVVLTAHVAWNLIDLYKFYSIVAILVCPLKLWMPLVGVYLRHKCSRLTAADFERYIETSPARTETQQHSLRAARHNNNSSSRRDEDRQLLSQSPISSTSSKDS